MLFICYIDIKLSVLKLGYFGNWFITFSADSIGLYSSMWMSAGAISGLNIVLFRLTYKKLLLPEFDSDELSS